MKCLAGIRSLMAPGMVLLLAGAAAGLDIVAMGGWTRTISAPDLSAGAGSNFRNQIESAAAETTLTISNTASGTWRVYARKAENVWHPGLSLSVRRTSDGAGAGGISGGGGYLALTDFDIEIFSGTGDRSGIAVQTKLAGMSRSVAPGSYQNAVIFTVTP